MRNMEGTSRDASDGRTVRDGRPSVTVELLAIGVATLAIGGVLHFGVLPVSFEFAGGLGAVLVGSGVGVALYSLEAIQESPSLEAVALGSAFLATAVTLYTGPWAAIMLLWGVAIVGIGLLTYGLVALSRRGSRG